MMSLGRIKLGVSLKINRYECNLTTSQNKIVRPFKTQFHHMIVHFAHFWKYISDYCKMKLYLRLEFWYISGNKAEINYNVCLTSSDLLIRVSFRDDRMFN